MRSLHRQALIDRSDRNLATIPAIPTPSDTLPMIPIPKTLLRALPVFTGTNQVARMVNRLHRKGFREWPAPAPGYVAQNGQDVFLDREIFRGRRDGIFVDIGAHDGRTLSNTWFFENTRGWKGVCIEPQPDVFAKLQSNRSAICLQGCVTDVPGSAEFLHVRGGADMLSGLRSKYDALHLDRIRREVDQSGEEPQVIQVPCFTFAQVLATAGLTQIDYLSVDTEGGELDILRSIDFSLYSIHVISAENSYHDGQYEHFLRSYGYSLRAVLGDDDIYVHRDFRP